VDEALLWGGPETKKREQKGERWEDRAGSMETYRRKGRVAEPEGRECGDRISLVKTLGVGHGRG